MHVEANSVNAFRPIRPLTAWGFPVFVALGWQTDDPLFVTGSGTSVAHWLYGVVVRGTLEAVRAQAQAVASPALVVQALPVLPWLTAVVCRASS